MNGKGTQKRKISIGLLNPKKLEGNTIYLQLKISDDIFNSEAIFAEAVSNEKFRYRTYNKCSGNSENVGKRVNNRYEDVNILHTVSDFLKMLKKENNAEVSEERFREEVGLTKIVK
jgi:hypothetical protein